MERLDDEVLQVTVAGAFFPALIRKLLEERMAEHSLTFHDLRKILRQAERKSSIVKRSFIVDGQETQISLEKAVWTDLKKIARGQGATVKRLVNQIDNTRQQGSLSSAIRLYVLEYFRTHGKNPP